MKDITISSGLNTILKPGTSNFGNTGSTASLNGSDGKSFGESLAESIEKVNNLQLEADRSIEDLATGKSQSIHETMLALGKADIAFRLTMQVRNKVVDAYQEIMRMPV